MHPNDAPVDFRVALADLTPKKPRKRTLRRATAVAGAAALGLALGACYGPLTSATSAIGVTCVEHQPDGTPTGVQYDADVTVGLTAPVWVGDDSDFPFRGASLSGVGGTDDPIVLAYTLSGASPETLYFAKNAADNQFDNPQQRHVTAPVGGKVTASFGTALVIHVNGDVITYDACTPREGVDPTVLTIDVERDPGTTTTSSTTTTTTEPTTTTEATTTTTTTTEPTATTETTTTLAGG